jgi:hypothetical protein
MTYPPQTQPPMTYPPQTQPPMTYPPQTQPPMTYPPQTHPATTNPYDAQNEPWRLYVRANEQFSCLNGRADGFYASRWCNVFYRCFKGIKYEFLCAKMQNGDRLWWIQHSTGQSLPQRSAQCQWPCETQRQCTSPGGVLREDGTTVSDSLQEAMRIFASCPANSNNNNNNHNMGYGPVTPPPQTYPPQITYPPQTSPPQTTQNYGNSHAAGGDDEDNFFTLPDRYEVCQGVPNNAFASSPMYCNVFHVCVAGKRKDFVCARATGTYDLWWNEQTKQCDWPCRVQCNKSVYNSTLSTNDIRSQNQALICNAPSGSGNNNYHTVPQTTGVYFSPTVPSTQSQTTTQPNYNNNNFFTVPQGAYGK